jgi:hypothetical protein
MEIGPTESQVGIIQFASTPKVEFILGWLLNRGDWLIEVTTWAGFTLYA